MKESYSLKDLLKQILVAITFVAIGFVIGLTVLSDNENHAEKPDITETEHKIDSLNQVIETLEAIKNGRIEEIKNLNDSATLSLFNELISK